MKIVLAGYSAKDYCTIVTGLGYSSRKVIDAIPSNFRNLRFAISDNKPDVAIVNHGAVMNKTRGISHFVSLRVLKVLRTRGDITPVIMTIPECWQMDILRDCLLLDVTIGSQPLKPRRIWNQIEFLLGRNRNGLRLLSCPSASPIIAQGQFE